jgi:hypothetical protein
MNKVTQSTIDSLAEIQNQKVLTLYVPTHKISTPATTKEDQARYRNLINKGLEEWEAAVDADSLKNIRTQLEASIADEALWSEAYKGLGVFATTDRLEFVHLPIESDEYVFVGEHFDLAPLRVALSQDRPYYALVLAKHNPKLLRGDSYNLEPVEIKLPESTEDALNIDEMFSGSNTVRGMVAPGGGNDTLSTHGQGDSNHAGQEEHLKFLRIIDNKILKSPQIDQQLPLLLTATDNEASDFKHISNNQRLLESHVQGAIPSHRFKNSIR